MTIRKLPAGVQDMLPEESRCLTVLRERLGRVFALNGYDTVASASLEYYDTYSDIRNALPQERMFKLTDTDGKLLVLRPDATLAISRIAATKLACGKARLCYFTTKWDLQEAGGLSSREIEQAGVERLGEEGAFSDAQTIAFSIECLKGTGLRDFIIDIGHVGYFKGVLEACGLSEADEERVRAYINRKDGMNAERVLKRAGAATDALNTVLALPALYGGAEILDRAERLTDSAVAREAVARLKEIYALLCDMGYEKYVCFDLGTVRRLSYYSGMVFEGLAKGLGASVLSGGRYDNLADDFGKHVPAVGFALGLKRILIALERQGNLPPAEPLEAVIVCERGAESAAYRELLRLAADGKRVRLSAEYGRAAARAAKGEAERVLFVTEKGIEEI